MVSDIKIHAVRLSHVHYQHPDLEQAVQFFLDFGMVIAQKDHDKVFLRGFGDQLYCYIAEISPDSKRHFIGGFWEVESLEELQKAALLPGATDVRDNNAPGRGKIVEVQDPNGYVVGFVYGQNPCSRLEKDKLEKTETIQNGSILKRRMGDVRRFIQAPSPVHKLGHYGFVLPPNRFLPTLQWYTTHLNLKITDATYNPESGEDESCFIHIDRGTQYTDHHVSQ